MSFRQEGYRLMEAPRRLGVVRVVGPQYAVIERADIGEGVFYPGKHDLPVGARVTFVQTMSVQGQHLAKDVRRVK
jgi:hypothetical protein